MVSVADVRSVRRTVLPNGLTVLSEEMDHIRSVSIGIWIKTGSRHEEPEQNGISHFIEHMVFKGTETRSAVDIARQIVAGSKDPAAGWIDLAHVLMCSNEFVYLD